MRAAVWHIRSASCCVLVSSLLLLPRAAGADPFGGQPPRCTACCSCPETSRSFAGAGSIGLTEGNLTQHYSVSRLTSGSGATLSLFLTYHSFNADGSHANVDTVLGYGWTHSYNTFLFSQRGHMFRMDGNGRITKFQRGPGGTFTPTPGYFETLVQNPDGTFTMTDKDKTASHFALIPDTPFLVWGPVYRLTRTVDRNNNMTTLSYADGNLTGVTDTYGRQLTFTYDSQHKLAAIADPLGRRTSFTYDPTGRQLLSITDPEGKVVRYEYNVSYQMVDKVDRDGRVFSYTYENGRPTAITDAVGANVVSLSNPLNWAIDATALARDLLRKYLPTTTTQIDGRGNVWRYEYDADGHLTRVTAPDGAATTSTYDPATLLVSSVTDANGHTTRYEYDALGNRTRIVNALGQATTFTYEPVFSQMTSMTDANGRVTRYTYDARGNQTQEIDPLGHVREWTYDARGNVLTEKDKRGHVTRYAYDAEGNRIATADALGHVTTFTYDAIGNLLTRTDANRHTTTFEYDALNRVIRETDPLGAVTHTIYDGEGNRVETIDRNGNHRRMEYDQRHRVIKTIDALGQESSQSYDGNDNRTAVTDPNGHTTAVEYDAQNRRLSTTDALGNVTSRSYDPAGNVLSEVDARGHTTTTEYDPLNRRTTTVDGVGNVTRFEYDSIGVPGCAECTGPTRGSSLVTKQTDGNGKVTYFKYDGLDRPILQIRKEGDTADVIDSSDAVTRYAYDANGNRVSMIEPNGNTAMREYDALNRRTKETNGAGDMTLAGYDPVGNVITIATPNGNVTTNSYDANDRLVQVEDRIGAVARYAYDPVGIRISETDGNGHTTRFEYDALYRLTKTIDPMGEAASHAYDPVGNLIGTTDREGRSTTHAYDALNRHVSTTDALGNTTELAYDAVGNLVRIVDANGNPTEYRYDGVNRLVGETYADGRARTFTYDRVGNPLSRTDQKGQTTTYVYNDLYFLLRRDYPVSADDNLTYDLSGRLLTAERAGWLVTFTYDGADRVVRTTQDGKTITYVYDIPGRRRLISYPGGRLITEQKDFRDRKAWINDGGARPLVEYSYDSGDRVGSRTYRNGTIARYTYNPNDWIVALEHSLGGVSFVGFRHTLDKEGHKQLEEKTHDNGRSEAYTYDGSYRLIDYKVGELVGSSILVPATQTAYNLDSVGNWNSKVTDGVVQNRTHNVVNEITSIDEQPVSYDPNGNLEEDPLLRYAYDEENRLIRVTARVDGVVVGQYQYDVLGRRVSKLAEVGGIRVSTRYFYDDARIVEEQEPGGATRATYTYGNYVDEVLTMDRAGQTYYYHQNALFSVFALTNAIGTVVEGYRYDAYGRQTVLTPGANGVVDFGGDDLIFEGGVSSVGNTHTFTGHELDSETGLLHARARSYHPDLGRFEQRDPDPRARRVGMNLYEYVRSNPIDYLDPHGLKPVCVSKLTNEGGGPASDSQAIKYGLMWTSIVGIKWFAGNAARGNVSYAITSSDSGVTAEASASGVYAYWYWATSESGNASTSATGNVKCTLVSEGSEECEASFKGGEGVARDKVFEAQVKIEGKASGNKVDAQVAAVAAMKMDATTKITIEAKAGDEKKASGGIKLEINEPPVEKLIKSIRELEWKCSCANDKKE